MHINEYANILKQERTNYKKSIKKAYDYGIETDWKNPNSTDVKLIRNPEVAAAYISKYLSKNEAEENETGIKADSRKNLNGRLWFQSRSLSRLRKITVKYNSKIYSIFTFLRNSKRTYKITGDWFTKVIFKAHEFGENLNDYLKRIFLTNAYLSSYPFPKEFHESYYHHRNLLGI